MSSPVRQPPSPSGFVVKLLLGCFLLIPLLVTFLAVSVSLDFIR